MSILRESRPTWAEVDLDRLARNVDVIARSLPDAARLIAVLKADGYGHGAVEVAKRLTAERVAMIATSLLEEALELQRAGIDLPLMVLGPLTREHIVPALDSRLTTAVIGHEELEDVSAVAPVRGDGIHP